MPTIWLVLAAAVAVAAVGAFAAIVTSWQRRNRKPDLGAVSYHWIADQRLGQRQDTQR